MPLKDTARLSEGEECLFRKVSFLRQSCVKRGSRMPLGEHKPVSSRLMRILRIDIHLRKIQISDDVRRGREPPG